MSYKWVNGLLGVVYMVCVCSVLSFLSIRFGVEIVLVRRPPCLSSDQVVSIELIGSNGFFGVASYIGQFKAPPS